MPGKSHPNPNRGGTNGESHKIGIAAEEYVVEKINNRDDIQEYFGEDYKEATQKGGTKQVQDISINEDEFLSISLKSYGTSGSTTDFKVAALNKLIKGGKLEKTTGLPLVQACDELRGKYSTEGPSTKAEAEKLGILEREKERLFAAADELFDRISQKELMNVVRDSLEHAFKFTKYQAIYDIPKGLIHFYRSEDHPLLKTVFIDEKELYLDPNPTGRESRMIFDEDGNNTKLRIRALTNNGPSALLASGRWSKGKKPNKNSVPVFKWQYEGKSKLIKRLDEEGKLATFEIGRPQLLF